MKIKITLLTITILLLAACGSNEAAPETTNVTETEAEPTEAEEAPAANTDSTDSAESALTLASEIDVHTAAQVQNRNDVFMLDVREQWEYDEGHIPNITLIPMGEIASRLQELPKDQEIILTCRSGNRSGQVTQFLRQQGFTNVHNMQGGILAWEAAGYEVAR